MFDPASLGIGGWPQVGLFVAATFVLNATPGVDLLLTVSRTLQGGARAGVAAAIGINAGCIVHTLAAAFGLAAVLALVPAAFVAIQWAGAAYLLWLAAGMWRTAWRTGGGAAEVVAVPPRSGWADFRTGLVTNVLNPKVALFFLAFLPQFIAPGATSKTLSFLLLGLWFIVQSLVFLLAVVWVSARLRRLAANVRLTRALQVAGGALFAALALRLLAGDRPAA